MKLCPRLKQEKKILIKKENFSRIAGGEYKDYEMYSHQFTHEINYKIT